MTISSSYYNYYSISSSSSSSSSNGGSSSSSRNSSLMIVILVLILWTIPTTISSLEVESINQALPDHATTPAPSPREPRPSSWSLPASQRDALLAFKRTIESDPLGILDQWDPDRYPDPCLWEGVQCAPPNNMSSSGHQNLDPNADNLTQDMNVAVDVITLALPRSRLLGPLAPELGQLVRLRHLNLHHNHLYGPIPARLFEGADGLKSLFLFSNNFSGSLPPEIGQLSSLQSLDLSYNSLSGSIPSSLMSGCARLAFVSLDHNEFSGPIPDTVPGTLEYLDVSHNCLDGVIPESIVLKGGLQVLNLSHNRISGGIPSSFLSAGTSIDVSYNNLSGPIPSNQNGASSADEFLGNPGLCGPPLPTICALAGSSENGRSGGDRQHGHGDNAWDGQEIALAVAMASTTGVVLMCIACLCCCYWGNTWGKAGRRIGHQCGADESEQEEEEEEEEENDEHYNKSITTSVMSHGSQKSTTILACCSSSSSSSPRPQSGEIGGHSYKGSDRVRPGRRGHRSGGGFSHSRWFKCARKPGPSVERYKGELVALEGGEVGFTIEELLRAAAYVLGKSCGAGIVYRVVVSEEVTVVVRRLGDGGGGGRNGHRHKEFESEVEGIAAARHPNVVRLRAYSCSPDEKLLVYDFLPNGNLGSALRRHGWHQQGLVWWARLKIARAVARAVAFLHEQWGGTAAHGDLKPNNILLDMGLEAYVADYGLGRLVSIAGSGVVPAPTRNTRVPAKDLDLHYYAPEAIDVVFKAGAGGETLFSLGVDRFVKATQKGDVYSMGMVLLELLTGISDDQQRRQRQSPQYIMHMNQLLLHEIDLTHQASTRNLDPLGHGHLPIDIDIPRPQPANTSPQPDLLLHILDPVLLSEMPQHVEQMVATLHLALSCVALHPEERPTMHHVSISLDQIVTHTPLTHKMSASC